jgi:hypothetical protein
VEQKVLAVEPERRQGRHDLGKPGHSSTRGGRAAPVLEAPGDGEQVQLLRKSREILQLSEELCGLQSTSRSAEGKEMFVDLKADRFGGTDDVPVSLRLAGNPNAERRQAREESAVC